MATAPSPTTLTRVARHKLDLCNKIHWKNQSSIQHYLLGANAKYTNLQVPVWRIGHANGVFVVTQAKEWFLMTKAEKKLERDAKRIWVYIDCYLTKRKKRWKSRTPPIPHECSCKNPALPHSHRQNGEGHDEIDQKTPKQEHRDKLTKTQKQ
jgi:hypothetical protein